MGVIARSHIPITIDSWKYVPSRKKDRLWQLLEVIHEKQSEKRAQNVYNHRTCRNGLDGLKEKLIEEGKFTADEIDRGVLWKEARQVKGKYPDTACEAKALEIDEFEKRRKDGTLDDEDANKDAITKCFGAEHPGRVRSAGKYITPTQFFGKPKSRNRVTKAQFEAILEENKRLKMKNAELEKEALDSRRSRQSSVASRPSLALPARSESSISPKIRKRSGNDMLPNSCFQTTANLLPTQNVPKRKRSGTGNDMLPKSTHKKGKPCKLLIDSVEVATGNVFDKTGKEEYVHNVMLGEDEFRVQVVVAIKPGALVPKPVGDEILTVHDALGTCVAWPKELIVAEGNGEETASSSDFLEDFLQDKTSALEKLGGSAIFIIDAKVFNSATNDPISIAAEDIESICRKEQRASVVNVVVYISYLHQKILSARKQNKYAFMDPTAITTNASSSSKKLTRELVNRMSKTEAEFIFVPYLMNKKWILMVVNLSVQKAWWLDSHGGHQDQEIDKIMKRVVEGCLTKRHATGSTAFCYPQHIPQHKNNWESGFYVMRFMKEIIEGQLNLNSTVMRKPKYDEGDITEVRREWINHVQPMLT
ncbi:hypothetical protein MKW94_021036 [Papaver nudicaule]|uniref:Ubiquitin-like protease family profile domain-containing protein n=1 Tax=Papaver nudicaule TaxID=74823 RepID=A0AA41VIS8_PAPNU|nr:hypothetical protein [Papaver nudicaule]